MRTDAEQAARKALAAGVRFFQYRNKAGSRRDIHETGLRLARMIRAEGALFIVNDHADIAAAVEADGVHLGQDDLPIEYARKLLGPERLIGVSTHSLDQARAAQAAGADYLGFGPLYPTETKDAGPVQGIDALKAIRKEITVPVIAVGGINRANAGEAVRAGADGVAVISGILSAPDIASASGDMISLINKARSASGKGGV